MAITYYFEFVLTDPSDPDADPVVREVISASDTVEFTPLEEDFGKELTTRLTVVNQFGSSFQQEKLGRIIDAFAAIVISGGTFTGSPRVNSTVTVAPIYSGGNPETPVIQYNFVDDTGASLQDSTSSSYTMTPDDLGKQLSIIMKITDIDGRESNEFFLPIGLVADEFSNPVINFITVTGAARLGNTVTVTNVDYAGGNPDNPVFEYEFVSRDLDGTEQSLQLSDEASYDIPEFDPDSEDDDELLGKRLLVRVKVIDVDGRESNIETESLGVIDDLDTPAIESLTFTGEIKLGDTIEITEVNYTGGNQNDPPSINYKFFVDDVQQTSDGSSYEIPVDFDLIGKIFSVEVQVTDADGRESQPYTSKLGQILDQYTAPEITFVSVDGVAVLGTTVTVTNVNYSGGNPSNPTVEYRFVARDSNANEETLQLSDNPSYEIPEFDPESQEDDNILGKRLLVDTKITDTDGRVSNTFRVNKGIISDAYDPITIQSIDIDGNLYPGQTITATINYTGGNPNSPTFDYRFTDSEGVFEEDLDSDDPFSTYTIDEGIEMVGTSITVEATVEDIDGRVASLAINTDAIELPPTIPEITAIEFTGNFNPGQEIQVIPEYIGGEAPYTIQYEFIDQDGTVLQSGSSDSSYTIQVADLGKSLAVKVIVTDVYGRPSEEVLAILGEVVTTISLDITTDVDNDEKADIYDDEVKIQSPDVPSGKLIPKWFMKYRG
tara:strand:- start:5757 stop:7916 length:2160 start_codon:yes stop_codon:yes gene_type:complete